MAKDQLQDQTSDQTSDQIGAEVAEPFTTGHEATAELRGLLKTERKADVAGVYRLMRSGRLDKVIARVARLNATPSTIGVADPEDRSRTMSVPSLLDAALNGASGIRSASVKMAERILK